jgi:hypothetical protein
MVPLGRSLRADKHFKDYWHSVGCKSRRTDEALTLYYQDSPLDVLGILAKEVGILTREMIHVVGTESCIRF